MTTKRFSSILILASLVLWGAGCGKSTTQLPAYYNTLGGFGVIASSPQVNDTYVSVATDLRVKFNEAVDEASIANNFKLTVISGKTYSDVTGKVTVSLSDSNSMLIFTPTAPLTLNVGYKLSLTGIKSVSARSMVRTFDLIFYTGAGIGTGFGINNDPNNPPSVASFQRDIWTGSSGEPCIGMTVRFSEDLITPPIGRVDTSAFFGLFTTGGMDLMFWPTYDGRANYWSADIGCGCDYFNFDGSYKVQITEAIDNSEDNMTSPYNTTFGIPFFQSCG